MPRERLEIDERRRWFLGRDAAGVRRGRARGFRGNDRHVGLRRFAAFGFGRQQRLAGGHVGERFLAHLVQLGRDVQRFALVARREAFAALDAAHEMREARGRPREHRLRRARERCAALLEREQRLLERARRRRDQRDAAGAVDAA